MRDPAADHRSDRRRKHGDNTRHGAGDRMRRAGNNRKMPVNTAGISVPPAKP